MRSSSLFFVSVLILGLSHLTGQAGSPKVVKSAQRKAEVLFDSRNQAVTVHLQPETAANPPSIEFRYLNANGQESWVELQAVKPSVYQGRVPAQESLIGVQVRVPFAADKRDLLR